MENVTFKCPLCGKNYSDAVKMANCIIKCTDEKKKNDALEKEKQAKVQFEQKKTELLARAKDLQIKANKAITEYEKTLSELVKFENNNSQNDIGNDIGSLLNYLMGI